MCFLLDFYQLDNMILGSYLREQHAQQSIIRDNGQKDFPWGNHKGEKTHNFLGDRMSTNSKSKTKKHKDDLQQMISLTCANTYSLTHAPQLSE